MKRAAATLGGDRHLPHHTLVRLATGGLFEPDVMTPAQWGAIHHKAHTMPELRLMHAVLEDALDTCGRHLTSDTDAVRAEARAWIASEDESWPFSYLNVCAALDLEPLRIRRAALAKGFRYNAPRDVHGSRATVGGGRPAA